MICQRCATLLPRFSVEEVLVRSPSPAEHLLSCSRLGNRGVDVVPQLHPRPLGFHHHRILLFDPVGKSKTTKKQADLVRFTLSLTSLLPYCLEWPRMAGNYLRAGVGNLFLLRGRRILDEKPGVSGREATNPTFGPLSRSKRNTAALLIYLSKQQQTRVTTRTCSIGKPGKKISASHLAGS